MTFVKTSPKIKVGDTVSLTKKIESLSGYFPEGSILKVIDIGTRGYSFEDEDGNQVVECGWGCCVLHKSQDDDKFFFIVNDKGDKRNS